MDAQLTTLAKKAFANKAIDLVSLLSKIRDARKQYALIEAMETEAARNGMQTGGMPTLGDEIMFAQQEKINQWGARAFPLSEKQIAVMVRDLEGYRK